MVQLCSESKISNTLDFKNIIQYCSRPRNRGKNVFNLCLPSVVWLKILKGDILVINNG